MFVLNDSEKAKILKYSNTFLNESYGFQFSAFDDIPYLSKKKAAAYYNVCPRLDEKTFSSTGTSGDPKTVNWSPIEDRWYLQEKREIFEPFLQDCKRIFITLGLGHNSNSSPRIFHDFMSVKRVGVGHIDNHLDEIVSYNPDSFYCSPSLLTAVIKQAGDRGISLPRIKKVILNGEVVYEGLIDYFCEMLQIDKHDILDTYGSTEIGTIAVFCHSCNKYHLMEQLIPETISAFDDDSALDIDKEMLVVTSLKRTSFPVLRFCTYDLVRALERSRCNGKDVYSLERINGRADDVLNYGELMPTSDIFNIIKKHYPDKHYLIFNYHNQVDIVVEGKESLIFRNEIISFNRHIEEMIRDKMLLEFGIHFVNDIQQVCNKYDISCGFFSKEKNRIVKIQYQAV